MRWAGLFDEGDRAIKGGGAGDGDQQDIVLTDPFGITDPRIQLLL